MVDVVAILSPVTRETVRAKIPAGKPLRDTLKIPDGVHVSINGQPDRGNPLSEGDLVNLIVVPQGGDSGKDALRTSIIIAGIIAAPYAAGALGMKTAAGLTFGGKLFAAGLSYGVAYGAYALIPPSFHEPDKETFNRLGAFTGSRNQVLPYGVVPRVYGHRRIYPPMSARPYTEIAGDKQFMRLLFNLGPGPLELSNPRIGDTLIGSFDSDNKFTSNGAFEGIEIDVAESPSLYASRVNQSAPNVTLENAWDSAVRSTGDDVEEISIDLTFPQGLFGIDDKGKTENNSVGFRIEYSPSGQDDWTYLQFPEVRLTSSKRETYRYNASWKVPKGKYDVRITRMSTYHIVPEEKRRISGKSTYVWQEDDKHYDLAIWTALRGITYEAPTKLPGTVQLAMRIQATDQLSGVLDNFSVEAKSRLAYYDGAQWQVPTFDPSTGGGTGGIVTSNPAWIVADILCGTANSRAIGRARLDEETFKDWADNCEAEGRECNIIIDSPRTVLQTASLVSATGRGSLSMRDNGIYSIIQDTEQTIPVQHFTPRNSWGFSSTRTFPDVPHAIRVNFVNPDKDWQTDEAIVYDDGYDEHTATKLEKLELEGVTNWDQAWKEGRYRLAEMRLRPEVYTLFADVEHIACTRGDLVLVSHDVTMWGLAAGRIKSISGNVLTLDETVTMQSGKTYNIRVRNSSGQSIVKTVSTSVGSHNQITVNNTTNIAAGDLFMFGEAGTETQALKVLSVEPQGDLSARLTLVDAAPGIYDADTGPIPPFDSNMTVPVDLDAPPPIPTIIGIRSDGDSLYRGSDLNPQMRIIVSFSVGDGPPTELIEGRFRRQDDESGWISFGSVDSTVGNISLHDVEKGATYIIQIRSRRGDKTSRWVQAAPHTAGVNVRAFGRPENAIGHTLEALDGTYSSLKASLYVPVREGMDYYIIDDEDQESIVITPTADIGPGEVLLEIEDQVIEAPEGSYIVRVPGQEEARDQVVPGFERVGQTLKVVNDELQAAFELIEGTLDDISNGIAFHKVAAGVLSEEGIPLLKELLGDLDDIDDGSSFHKVASTALSGGIPLLSQALGDLDDLDDGVNYAKVASHSLTDQGLILLSGAVGDLDDIDDGSISGKVNKAALTSGGLILLSGAVGDLDDIDDGVDFAKVKSASLTPEGLVLLSQSVGTLDDIDDGDDFARIDKSSLTAEGLVLLSATVGTLDDVEDGSTYGRVDRSSLTSGGLVLLSGTIGDLDDIDDGVDFRRVKSAQLTPEGLVLLSQAVGDMDDLDDGDTYGKVLMTSISQGKIVLAEVEGDMDDLEDGASYGKVSVTSIENGKILLAQAVGDMDDVDDGSTHGKVLLTSLSSGKIVLAEAVGNIDDIADGGDYAKTKSTAINANGLVILAAVEGTLDDIDDGGTYAKVRGTDVSAGRIRIFGPDGQTVINNGVINTDALFASTATISSVLTIGPNSIIIKGSPTANVGAYIDQFQNSLILLRDPDNHPQLHMIRDGVNERLSLFSDNSGWGMVLTIDNNAQVSLGAGGLRLRSGSLSSGSIHWFDNPAVSGASNQRARISMTSTQLTLTGISRGIRLDTTGGDIDFFPGSGQYLKFISIPTSNPGGSNRVWRDASGFLRIT